MQQLQAYENPALSESDRELLLAGVVGARSDVRSEPPPICAHACGAVFAANNNASAVVVHLCRQCCPGASFVCSTH